MRKYEVYIDDNRIRYICREQNLEDGILYSIENTLQPIGSVRYINDKMMVVYSSYRINDDYITEEFFDDCLLTNIFSKRYKIMWKPLTAVEGQ